MFGEFGILNLLTQIYLYISSVFMYKYENKS